MTCEQTFLYTESTANEKLCYKCKYSRYTFFERSFLIIMHFHIQQKIIAADHGEK